MRGSTDLELETERAGLAGHCVAGSSKLKQGMAKLLLPVGREAKRNQEHGFEAPDRVGWRQQVVTNFRVFNNNNVNIRKTHGLSVLPKFKRQQESLARSAQRTPSGSGRIKNHRC